jgi:hypothetical protein
MLDIMNVVMGDLMAKARLLKTAQTMQAPRSMVSNSNANTTLGGTSTYAPGLMDALGTFGLGGAFLPGIGGAIGAGALLLSAPGQAQQGFDAMKQWLPSAGAFRKELTLPSSF